MESYSSKELTQETQKINSLPKISILLPTYNRAHLVTRAIDSILNQTYQNFEIVIVNNGSQDNTKEVLQSYEKNPKIKVLHLEKNRGYAGGFNYGLQFVRGEWFTEIGDDDLIKEDALEKLIHIPENVDPNVNAVTCNAINTSTNKMAGMGLDKSQYLPIDKLVADTSGIFWGITKTELIGDLRINENLPGHEQTFWRKVDVIANRYYLHEALFIWDTAHDITTSGKFRLPDLSHREKLYIELLNEHNYWDSLQQYNPMAYEKKSLKGYYFLKICRQNRTKEKYREMFFSTSPSLTSRFKFYIIALSPRWLLSITFYAYCRSKFTWPFSMFYD